MCLTSLSICQGALGDLIVKGNALPEEQNNEDNEVLKGQLSRLHLRAQTQQGALGSGVALSHLPGASGTCKSKSQADACCRRCAAQTTLLLLCAHARATSAHVETARRYCAGIDAAPGGGTAVCWWQEWT